jgi:hypothetical protein
LRRRRLAPVPCTLLSKATTFIFNSYIKVNFRSRPNRKAFDYILGIVLFA